MFTFPVYSGFLLGEQHSFEGSSLFGMVLALNQLMLATLLPSFVDIYLYIAQPIDVTHSIINHFN